MKKVKYSKRDRNEAIRICECAASNVLISCIEIAQLLKVSTRALELSSSAWETVHSSTHSISHAVVEAEAAAILREGWLPGNELIKLKKEQYGSYWSNKTDGLWPIQVVGYGNY